MEKRQVSIAAEDREEAQRRLQEIGCQILRASRDEPVSYTHLDTAGKPR